MPKITIWGTGRVGLSAVDTLFKTQASEGAEIVLYSPHNYKKIEGDILDLEDAVAVSGRSFHWNAIATNKPEDMAGSDLVFYCAGGTPTAKEYAEGAEKGMDDRMVQGQKNISMIVNFYSCLKKYAPEAKIFVVSNPVDMMTELMRGAFAKNEVYGLGCYLDTGRYKREFVEALRKNGVDIPISDFYGMIAGSHDGNMFPLEESIFFPGMKKVSKKIMKTVKETALKNTKGRGLYITNVRKAAPKRENCNNGSHFAPGEMIADIIRAYVIGGPLRLTLNRPITEEDNVGFVGEAAQLPAVITKGDIKSLFYPYTETDKENLRISIERKNEASGNFFKEVQHTDKNGVIRRITRNGEKIQRN